MNQNTVQSSAHCNNTGAQWFAMGHLEKALNFFNCALQKLSFVPHTVSTGPPPLASQLVVRPVVLLPTSVNTDGDNDVDLIPERTHHLFLYRKALTFHCGQGSSADDIMICRAVAAFNCAVTLHILWAKGKGNSSTLDLAARFYDTSLDFSRLSYRMLEHPHLLVVALNNFAQVLVHLSQFDWVRWMTSYMRTVAPRGIARPGNQFITDDEDRCMIMNSIVALGYENAPAA